MILVYDLNNKSSLNKLPKWAADIANKGSFVAPFSEDTAARNIGRLPVPVLVVGNKADRLRLGAGDAGSLSSIINNACSQVLSSTACSSWWRRSISGMRGRRAPSETNIAPDMEQHVKGLTASAALGQIDWELLNDFFTTLWERRYKPLTGASMTHEYMHRTPSYTAFGMNPSSTAAVLKAGQGLSVDDNHDDRVDDDWV